MRTPRLTRKILAGLSEAMSRMEADDISDLDDILEENRQAAERWLSEAYQRFASGAADKTRSTERKELP